MPLNYAGCLIQSLIDTQVIHKCYSTMVPNDLQIGVWYFSLDLVIFTIYSTKNPLAIVHFFRCKYVSFSEFHQPEIALYSLNLYCLFGVRTLA